MTGNTTTIPPTMDEVARGIYIDCEGRIGQPPAEMGIYEPSAGPDTPVRQVVLIPALRPAADAKGLEVIELETLIDELVSRAESEDRALIGWSCRELEVVFDYCSPELALRFAAVYRDAKKAAKTWRVRQRLALPKSSTARGAALSRFARLIGYRAESSLWSRGSAQTIGMLEDAFTRGRTYETLGRGRAAADRKAKWTVLLRHNQLDCRATYEVARVATMATSA